MHGGETAERTTQAIRVSEMMVCCAGHSEVPIVSTHYRVMDEPLRCCAMREGCG